MAEQKGAAALKLPEELKVPPTEKPERELPQAPEVKGLTEGTKEKALKVIEGGEKAAPATAETPKTPEEIQKETATAAAATAGVEPSPPIAPPAATEQAPAEPQKKGWFKKYIGGFFGWIKQLIFGAKKE